MDLAYETLKIHKNWLAPKLSKTPNDILKWFQAQVLHYKKVTFNFGSFLSYNKYISFQFLENVLALLIFIKILR